MLPQETTPAPTEELYHTTGRVPNDLVPMEELEEYEIATGEPDPRGWDLLGSDDSRLGTIEELLVSPSTMTAYFALVEGGRWIDNRRFLLPLGEVQFMVRTEQAYTRRHRGDFFEAPEYRAGASLDYNRHNDYWTQVPRTGEFYIPE